MFKGTIMLEIEASQGLNSIDFTSTLPKQHSFQCTTLVANIEHLTQLSAILIPKEIRNFLIAGGIIKWTSIILRGWIIFTIIYAYYVSEFAIFLQHYHLWTYWNILLIIIEYHNSWDLISQQKVQQLISTREIHLCCHIPHFPKETDLLE